MGEVVVPFAVAAVYLAATGERMTTVDWMAFVLEISP
jgi:hypothetical protein